MERTKTKTCECGNTITAEAHTEPDEKSVYGFRSVFTFTGVTIHHLNLVVGVCNVCTLEHDFERFTDKFHADAVKESAK